MSSDTMQVTTRPEPIMLVLIPVETEAESFYYYPLLYEHKKGVYHDVRLPNSLGNILNDIMGLKARTICKHKSTMLVNFWKYLQVNPSDLNSNMLHLHILAVVWGVCMHAVNA